MCVAACGDQKLILGALVNHSSFYLLRQGLSLNPASASRQLTLGLSASASQALRLQELVSPGWLLYESWGFEL